MCDECKDCQFRRNCINGLYCMKIKEYVQYVERPLCFDPFGQTGLLTLAII